MNYHRHETAVCEAEAVGAGTRIRAFAHVLAGAVIGENCEIWDHTFIENGVRIGSRVTIKCGVQLWDGITIEDDVFIGANATFTSDPVPGGSEPGERRRTVVKRGASIGANATIFPALIIGERAMVGAGSVVTQNVPPNAIVSGNPARIVGYVGAFETKDVLRQAPPEVPGRIPTRVAGVTLYRLPHVDDLRGPLVYAEVGRHLPFEVKRWFLVHDVATQETRGEHAHRSLHQFLLCPHGKVHLMADDGKNRQEFVLDSPSLGVHLPPMVWGVQYGYSADAVLLVMASDFYDPGDYIRDYSEFLSLRAAWEAARAE